MSIFFSCPNGSKLNFNRKKITDIFWNFEFPTRFSSDFHFSHPSFCLWVAKFEDSWKPPLKGVCRGNYITTKPCKTQFVVKNKCEFSCPKLARNGRNDFWTKILSLPQCALGTDCKLIFFLTPWHIPSEPLLQSPNPLQLREKQSYSTSWNVCSTLQYKEH